MESDSVVGGSTQSDIFVVKDALLLREIGIPSSSPCLLQAVHLCFDSNCDYWL